MDAIDNALLRELQEELKLERRPFLRIAKALELTEEQVLGRVEQLLQAGMIRRIGIAVKPEKLGHLTNVLVAWNIPPEHMEDVGSALAALPEVSHCYERDAEPDWPHRLFTMIHARDEEHLRELLVSIETRFGLHDRRLFPTKRELKKTSPRLFTEAKA